MLNWTYDHFRMKRQEQLMKIHRHHQEREAAYATRHEKSSHRRGGEAD